jgi:hypothetical protein
MRASGTIEYTGPLLLLGRAAKESKSELLGREANPGPMDRVAFACLVRYFGRLGEVLAQPAAQHTTTEGYSERGRPT